MGQHRINRLDTKSWDSSCWPPRTLAGVWGGFTFTGLPGRIAVMHLGRQGPDKCILPLRCKTTNAFRGFIPRFSLFPHYSVNSASKHQFFVKVSPNVLESGENSEIGLLLFCSGDSLQFDPFNVEFHKLSVTFTAHQSAILTRSSQ